MSQAGHGSVFRARGIIVNNAPDQTEGESLPLPEHLIQRQLDDRGWSQRTLAVILDISETSITRFLSGKQPIDAAFAVALEEVLGVPAAQLLQLQTDRELAGARTAHRPDPRRALRARVYGNLPLSRMIRRGWIDADDIRDTVKVDAALCRLFGRRHTEGIATLLDPAASPAGLALHAWKCRVRQIARAVEAPPYSQHAARAAIARLHALLGTAAGVARAPDVLQACGIRLVLVESLPGAGAVAATTWLDDTAPVIGLSLSEDRIDRFWFQLRHALEHVLSGQDCALPAPDGEHPNANDEIAANAAADAFCVPPALFDDFIARRSFIATHDMLTFAAELCVHPGLVAGRVQDKTLRHRGFTIHLARVRAILMAHAPTDGWGRKAL